jgi:hypothetical protein
VLLPNALRFVGLVPPVPFGLLALWTLFLILPLPLRFFELPAGVLLLCPPPLCFLVTALFFIPRNFFFRAHKKLHCDRLADHCVLKLSRPDRLPLKKADDER